MGTTPETAEAKLAYIRVTDGTLYRIGGADGSPGAPGAPGAQGPPGGAYLSAQWNFNQNTVVSPASGTMRMNATTYAAVTQLWVSETDRDGLDRSSGLSLAKPGDQIMIQSAQGRAVFNVTAQADSGTYRTLTVTLVESSGTRPSASSTTTLYVMNTQTGHTIQDEGTPVTYRTALNFVGAGVTAADDSGNDRVNITIPGGGGGTTLDSLTDVDTTGVVNWDSLVYAASDLTATKWVGAPVSVSESGHYSTFVAANAWDNNASTNWNTGAGGFPSCAADFGVPVSAVRVFAASASAAATWLLEGSLDGVAWTTVKTGVTAPVGAGAYYDFPRVTFRYWRISGGISWSDLHSMTLYDYVNFTPKWVPGSVDWIRWTGTQAAYDAIVTKDPRVLYVVV